MKFKITRDNLQKGLAAVAASIPTRTTLPVLSNILIDVDGDSVAMSGTDLDIAVRLRVPAEVDEEGSLTVPAMVPSTCAALTHGTLRSPRARSRTGRHSRTTLRIGIRITSLQEAREGFSLCESVFPIRTDVYASNQTLSRREACGQSAPRLRRQRVHTEQRRSGEKRRFLFKKMLP